MRKVLLNRALHAVIVVTGVLILVFTLVRLTGDPVPLLLGPEALAEDIAQKRREMGLDQPIPVQFALFARDIARGDFGTSLRYRRPALPLVVERIPATAELTVAAMLLTVAVSLPLGMFAARRRNTPADHATMLVAVVGQSLPGFWVGLMLILLFPLTLGIFYTSGRGTFGHLILPALTLSLFPIARLTRLTRSVTLEVLGQDYIRTARAKGVHERLIMSGHALRNILIPVTTIIGLEVATLFGGAVVTETVFEWPGMGQLAITAVAARDYPLVQASVIVVAVVVVSVGFVVDFIYALIDPRIRAEGSS